MSFEELGGRYHYLLTVVLLAVGLWGMIGKRNLVKKVIALNIFQTAVLLFFIEGAAKDGGSVPVIDEGIGTDPSLYLNPLPHVLMLTAIVVGVALTGVALSLLLVIHRSYGSLEEDEVLGRARDPR